MKKKFNTINYFILFEILLLYTVTKKELTLHNTEISPLLNEFNINLSLFYIMIISKWVSVVTSKLFYRLILNINTLFDINDFFIRNLQIGCFRISNTLLFTSVMITNICDNCQSYYYNTR